MVPAGADVDTRERYSLSQMDEVKSRSPWPVIGIVAGTVLWVVATVVIVVVAVSGTSVDGTYTSKAGTIELAKDGSGAWTSRGTTVEGRYIINSDEITLKPPEGKGKNVVFERVEKDLKKGDDLYVKQVNE